MSYYVSQCPDTGRVFICETGADNNVCEVFARDGREDVKTVAQRIAHALNIADVCDDMRLALSSMTCTYRTFRGVPKSDQEWTPIDDEVLDYAFKVLERVEEIK